MAEEKTWFDYGTFFHSRGAGRGYSKGGGTIFGDGDMYGLESTMTNSHSYSYNGNPLLSNDDGSFENGSGSGRGNSRGWGWEDVVICNIPNMKKVYYLE